jgi:hypothetical protein
MNSNGTRGTAKKKATKVQNKKVKSKSKSNTKVKSRGSRRKNLGDDGYVRSTVTATEMLTGEQIKERIKNYERVLEDDLRGLKTEDKIAYFEVLDDGKFKYKPGGYLLVNGAPKYMVLTSSKGSWSVQLDNHIIFKAREIDEIEERHKDELDDRMRNERHLRQLLIKQKKVINILRSRIDELEEKYDE